MPRATVQGQPRHCAKGHLNLGRQLAVLAALCQGAPPEALELMREKCLTHTTLQSW